MHLCGVRSLAFHGEGKLHRAVLALAVRTGHGLVVQVVEAVARPLIHRPVVIVGGGAESVEFRTLAAFNHRLVAVSEVANSAFCLGERHAEAFARHGDAVGGFNGLLQRAAAGVDALRDVGRLDRQLLVHLHIALLGPRLVGFKHKLDFHEIFARCVKLGRVEGQGNGLALAGFERVALDGQCSGLGNADAVLPKRPHDVVVGEIFKVILVENLNRAAVLADSADAHVLINLLHLKILRFGREVGAHHAVHAECAVVGLVVKVAAVGPELAAGLGVVVVLRLVHPVPNCAADKEVCAFDSVPVVDEVAHGVAHRVGVFGDVEGINEIIFTLHGTLYPRDAGILVRTYVHDVVVALILHGTRGIEGLNRFVGFHEIVARAGFIAQTPNTYGGVVHAGVYHFHIAGHVGILKLRHVRETGIAVIVLVALDVCFVFEIDAIFVAKIVPVGRTGVVRVAHVVDVAALHEHHFLLHLLAGNGVAAVGIVLVAVHALHLNRLAVEVVVAAGEFELVIFRFRLLHFDLAEAHGGGERFNHLALLVFELSHEDIHLRALCAPGLHLCAGFEAHANVLLHVRQQFFEGGNGRHACNGLVAFAVKLVLVKGIVDGIILNLFLVKVLHLSRNVERSVGIGGIVVGNAHDVAHLHLGLRREVDIAVDARQAEHVLAFEERGVAVAVYFDRQNILALLQIRRDVKLREVARVFRETHVAAVDVEIEERVHAVEVEVDHAPFPVCGHGERAAVRANFVSVVVGQPVFARLAHHAALPVAHCHVVVEDDALVRVDGQAVFQAAVLADAGDVPAHRHFHLVPAGGAERCFIEIFRALVGSAHPVEIPCAVERLEIRARFG